jgi:MFS transporter, PHS family, inorganic phosphate transporter
MATRGTLSQCGIFATFANISCKDLAFYGLGLNNTIVLHAIGYAEGDNLFDKLYNQAVGMIILACAGSLPGYWTAVLTIDTIGRKPLQIIGFMLLTVIFCILGFMLHNLSESALLALYVFAQFLFNAGPNTTTFIVPGECFPTRYRSTAHGISAASGKIGAIVAQAISIPLLRRGSPDECMGNECTPNLDRLLQLFALFMLLGTLVSFLIPETKGITLEELAGEPRTSYNSGCNGSIHLDTSRARKWNPFHVGQPAGFNYTRSHSGRFRLARNGAARDDSEAPSADSRSRRRFWRKTSKGRMAGDETNSIALSNRSSATEAAHLVDPVLSPQEIPSWGAGWGRVERSRAPISIAQLQDVGSLLKQP